FSRLAVGHLETCANIHARKVVVPLATFRTVMNMPASIIYPGIADYIGRLHNPQRVVAFFTRLGEVKSLVELVALQTGRMPAVVLPNDVVLLAYAWIDICRFGKWI